MFKNSIAWIDLETTGLYGKSEEYDYGERDHSILEVAMIITDHNLNVLDYATFVVKHDMDEIKSKMCDFVIDMHTKSGLMDDLKGANTKSLYSIETELINMLDKHGIKSPVLGGSSIHFDRFFISCQMPRLNKTLHHRNFDVSTFKMAHDMLYDTCLVEGGGGVSHRALDDIFHSYNRTFSILRKIVGV